MTANFFEVDAVLFDLDGTLVDSAPDMGAAADKMRTDRGMPSLPLAAYRPMAGSGARGMLSVGFDMAPDHPDFAAMKEEFFTNYESRLTAQTVAFDGVTDLIEELVTRKLPWGVVTNKAARFTIPLTRAMAVFETAGAIVSGDTTAHTKPHPEPLFEAARLLKVAPARCLYVGDDQRDIVAGLAAGMTTVAATYGYLGRASDTTSWGAQASIRSPLALLSLLRPG
jgi:N-acetyl-D-muramate 6-phosphate phosphatase